MPAVVSTPVLAYVATLLDGAASAVGQSSSITCTVNIPSAWEIQLPVRAHFTTVSADPVVNVYAASDGGTGYDSIAFAAFSITRVTAGSNQASIRLPAGRYAIQILNSGPNTASFQILTQQVLTAVLNQ